MAELTENAKKYLGWGLIAAGVGVIGYSIYAFSKKKTSSALKPALAGVGSRKKKKTTKKLPLK